MKCLRWLYTLVFVGLVYTPIEVHANPYFVQLGTGASGSGTVSPVRPASGVLQNDLFVICMANKPRTATPTVPAGWTEPANNTGYGDDGSSGEDLGSVRATVFYKVAAADNESGSVAITISGGTSAYANILHYRNNTGTWSVATAQGADNTLGTDYSATTTTDPGITTDDLVPVCHAKTHASNNFALSTSETISTPGVAYDHALYTKATNTYAYNNSLERTENGTSTGTNSGIIVSEHAALYGPSTDVSTVSFTYSGNNNLGASVIIRLRQTNSPSYSAGCTTTVADLSAPTIQTAIQAYDAGATICLPAGTGTWTSTTTQVPAVYLNKGITLLGTTVCTGTPVTCADSTIINDGTNGAAGTDPLQVVGTSARVSGITFKDPRNQSDSGPMIRTACNLCRIDHNSFSEQNTGSIIHGIIGQSYDGVSVLTTNLVDHNYFSKMNGGVNPHGDYPFEPQPRGSKSWTIPVTMGDSLAMYVENNNFDSDIVYNGAYDSYDGSRIVFRYNYTKNYNMGGHGFDSGDRSTLRQELYRNTVTMPNTSAPSWFQTRGGSFMIWQNTVTGTFTKHIAVTYYRSHPINQFYATTLGVPASKHVCGGATNPDSFQPTFNTAGHGYVFSSPNNLVQGNTAATEQTEDGNTPGQFGYPCRDQPGYSSPSSGGNLDWPYILDATRVYAQVLLPMYSFGNTFLGATPAAANVDVHAPNICTPSQPACPKPVPLDDDSRMETYHVLFNRELYVEQAGFDGTAGTGTGTSDPAVAFPNCAKGVFYFRTNVGTWNTSGDGLGSGLGYLCDPANTWNVYYTPYTYPHPLNADPTPIPAAPTNLRKIGETTSTSCMVTWDASAMANQLGYHVFSGTSTGVYTSVVNKTAATAAATNSIETMHTFVFPLPGTYYISVTAYSAIGDSAYATEVTCTSTGVSRTGGTRTPTGPRTPR